MVRKCRDAEIKKIAKDKIIFRAQGYLEKTYLDKEGAKHATFEFSIKDAVELAKLELMARDLNNHIPTLLNITVIIAKNNEKVKNRPPIKKYR